MNFVAAISPQLPSSKHTELDERGFVQSRLPNHVVSRLGEVARQGNSAQQRCCLIKPPSLVLRQTRGIVT